MNKTTAKVIINFYGIAFLALGAAALFGGSKAIVGVLVLIVAGFALLRRKYFGVYTVLFLSLGLSGIGGIFEWIAVNDLLHKNFKPLMLFMGLVPIAISVVSFYLFTRKAVAEEFGMEKITIIDKIDKKELLATFKILLWIIGIIGGVLLFSYFVAMRMSR